MISGWIWKRSTRLVAEAAETGGCVAGVQRDRDGSRRGRHHEDEPTSGCHVVVDAAQSVPHLPVDVQALGCRFPGSFRPQDGRRHLVLVFFMARKRLLDAMPPFMGGGSMIRKVTLEGTTYADVPARFEAGTPAVADQVGLGAAVRVFDRIGMDQIRAHELELVAYAWTACTEVPGSRRLWPAGSLPAERGVSFTLGDIHPHDVAAILDDEGRRRSELDIIVPSH